jgi:hypothetical protein
LPGNCAWATAIGKTTNIRQSAYKRTMRIITLKFEFATKTDSHSL